MLDKLKKTSLNWGICLILLAILFVIDGLHLWTNPWTDHLAITFLLLIGLWNAVKYRLVVSSTLLLTFLIMLHRTVLGLSRVSNWTLFGAGILISIGASLIYQPTLKRFTSYFGDTISRDSTTVHATMQHQKIDFDDLLTSLNIKTFASSVSVSFEHAELPAPDAKINLSVFASEVKLYVPLEWNISSDDLTTTFSQVQVDGQRQGTQDKTLILTGNLTASQLTLIRV